MYKIIDGAWGAPLAQCARSVRSATIWVFGRTKNPYFVILGTSLLFGNRFLMLLPHLGHGMFGFSPTSTHFHVFSPIFTHSLLISRHVLFSRLISPHYG